MKYISAKFLLRDRGAMSFSFARLPMPSLPGIPVGDRFVHIPALADAVGAYPLDALPREDLRGRRGGVRVELVELRCEDARLAAERQL